MGRVVCLSEVESWRSEVRVAEGEDSAETASGNDEVVKKEKIKQALRGPFVPTVEEVHEAFDWIKPIRYHQPLHLGGELFFVVRIKTNS